MNSIYLYIAKVVYRNILRDYLKAKVESTDNKVDDGVIKALDEVLGK